MTTKKIYLIRHGQTDFNLKGIVQGRGINASINELGKAQAEAFYQTYRHIPFDAVYTSTLKRSIESVKRFIDLNIAHYALSDLDEIDWGKKEGEQITGRGEGHCQQAIKQWKEGEIHVCIEGGESPVQVATRQQRSIQTILKRSNEKIILMCMHGRAIRILLCQFLHYPLSKMDVFSHQNLSLYTLHYTGSIFQVDTFNNTDHLTEHGIKKS